MMHRNILSIYLLKVIDFILIYFSVWQSSDVRLAMESNCSFLQQKAETSENFQTRKIRETRFENSQKKIDFFLHLTIIGDGCANRQIKSIIF